jgi:hypothetical protein
MGEIRALMEQGDSPEDKRALRKLVVLEREALGRRRYNDAKVFARFDAMHIPAAPLAHVYPSNSNALCAPLVTASASRGQGH